MQQAPKNHRKCSPLLAATAGIAVCLSGNARAASGNANTSNATNTFGRFDNIQLFNGKASFDVGQYTMQTFTLTTTTTTQFRFSTTTFGAQQTTGSTTFKHVHTNPLTLYYGMYMLAAAKGAPRIAGNYYMGVYAQGQAHVPGFLFVGNMRNTSVASGNTPRFAKTRTRCNDGCPVVGATAATGISRAHFWQLPHFLPARASPYWH
jgi:hypothetical protein